MLTIEPSHWNSWDVDVIDDVGMIAHIDVSVWWEKGVLTIDGVNWLAIILWKRESNASS